MCEVKVVPGSRRLHTWHRPLPPLSFFPWVAVLSGLCVLALNVRDSPLNSYVFERMLIRYFLDGLCAKKKNKQKPKRSEKWIIIPFPSSWLTLTQSPSEHTLAESSQLISEHPGEAEMHSIIYVYASTNSFHWKCLNAFSLKQTAHCAINQILSSIP